MAGEPGPGPAHPGLKRPQGTASPCTSDYDLDHKLYREDVPYRVYEYQRIPPLINRVPVKIRRTQVGMGVKSSFRLHTGPRKSHLPREQIKLPTEELHSIRGELSQIKAQVDRLLENLEHMGQQRDQLPTGGLGHIPRSEDSEENRGPESKGSSCRITELQQEPRGQRAHPEADSSEDSTDPEEAVKNPASDQEGSQ
ncbi:RNA-binding Raly-like protein isoform X2 [Vulpes vulpes]|uniref:RNA-binding Raly-like protein isoform X2 n=1 Tax=Vulpes vulpes TaxID=9627 RepID=A0ABM4YBH8_VULVU